MGPGIRGAPPLGIGGWEAVSFSPRNTEPESKNLLPPITVCGKGGLRPPRTMKAPRPRASPLPRLHASAPRARRLQTGGNSTSRRHGLWPCSAMQVVYVYHGMALELYSLALLKAKTEHL